MPSPLRLVALSLAVALLAACPVTTPVVPTASTPDAVIKKSGTNSTPAPVFTGTPTPAPAGALTGRVLVPQGVTAATGANVSGLGALATLPRAYALAQGPQARRLLSLSQVYLGAGASVQIFNGQNIAVTTAVTTDESGRYYISPVPTTGGPYLVKVGIKTLSGEEGAFETLVRTDEPANGDIDLVSTLVTAAIVSEAQGVLTAVRAREFKRAMNLVSASLPEEIDLDLSRPASLAAFMSTLASENTELRATLNILTGITAQPADTPTPAGSQTPTPQPSATKTPKPEATPTSLGTLPPLTGPGGYKRVLPFVGVENTPGLKDEVLAKAQVRTPQGLSFDADGNLYVADRANHAIRRISVDGHVLTLAGNGTSGVAVPTCAGADARFNDPVDVAVVDAGTLFVLDRGNRVIRKITHLAGASVVVTTFSGKGTPGFTEGPAATAEYDTPQALAYDGVDSLFVTDARVAARILKVDATTGAMVRYAGDATQGVANGDVNAARFRKPVGIAARWINDKREVWIADPAAGNLRRIVEEAGGGITVSTAAGPSEPDAESPDSRVYAERDTLPLTDARFKRPSRLAFSPAGDLFVLDAGSGFVRWLRFASGDPFQIYTLRPENVGTGGSTAYFQLDQPAGVAMGPLDGKLYVSQDSLARISVID